MFRATRRSVSERGRFSLETKAAVVFPLIATVCSGLSALHSQSVARGPFDPVRTPRVTMSASPGTSGFATSITLSHQQAGYVDIRIVQSPDGSAPSFVEGTGWISSGDLLLRVQVLWSHYANPRGKRRAMGRELEMNRFVVETLSVRPLFDNEETVDLMESHWGSDWAVHLPIPLLDLLDRQQFEQIRKGENAASADLVIRSTLVDNGRLVIETKYPWMPFAVAWTLVLWVLTGIGYALMCVVSRERKARRWVAMKCPKCGYERQRDRDECPECGLVYERPSYGMWDPTEEEQERGG